MFGHILLCAIYIRTMTVSVGRSMWCIVHRIRISVCLIALEIAVCVGVCATYVCVQGL